jgi:hypothetical protein
MVGRDQTALASGRRSSLVSSDVGSRRQCPHHHRDLHPVIVVNEMGPSPHDGLRGWRTRPGSNQSCSCCWSAAPTSGVVGGTDISATWRHVEATPQIVHMCTI